MDGVGVDKVFCSHEEGLQAFVGAGDDGRIITEQQASDDGHHDDGYKVGFVAFFCVIHDIKSFDLGG